MDKNILVKKVTEEIEVGLDLGYKTEHIAKNVIAILAHDKEHLDFNPSTNQYDWEQET
ncbi:MAG: hypothetical protein ACFFG0_01820 [Candidatus Thorarchaeota archaeon]